MTTREDLADAWRVVAQHRAERNADTVLAAQAAERLFEASYYRQAIKNLATLDTPAPASTPDLFSDVSA